MLAVALFFAVSGISLMYNYDERLDLKTYYKKRFLGIYPVFWIAYSLLFLYSFWRYKGFFVGEPIYKLILSFLGMDGYLANYTGTFYLIGDWFLGCIIIMYIIFPLLQYVFLKIPKILFAISTIIYLLVLYKSNFKIPLNQNLLVSIYSFLIGMYYMKYVKDVKIWQVIPLIIISSVILFVTFEKIHLDNVALSMLESNIVACCFFIILKYFGSKINITVVKNIINYISKYSYIIFLLQHYVILELNEYFSGSIVDKYGMLCAYLICWVIILSLGKLIYILNKKILDLFKKQEV